VVSADWDGKAIPLINSADKSAAKLLKTGTLLVLWRIRDESSGFAGSYKVTEARPTELAVTIVTG
jgi:hypothetical protein